MRRRSRSRRRGWLARLAAGAALASVFAGSAGLAVALHLDLPASRALAERASNRALGSIDGAAIAIAGVDRWTLGEVRARALDVTVSGAARCHAEGVALRGSLLRIAWRALVGGAPAIEIREASVERVDCALLPSEGGGEREEAGRAAPAEQQREDPRSGPAIAVRVELLTLGHGEIRGLPPEQGTSAEIEGLRASGSWAGGLARARAVAAITVRGALAVPIRVELDGEGRLDLTVARAAAPAALPAPPALPALPRELVAMAFQGRAVARAGDASISVMGALAGDELRLDVELPPTSPEAIRALWPAAPLTAPVSARVRVDGALSGPLLRIEASVGGGSVRADGRLDVATRALALHVTARDIDARAFAPSAPTTRIGFGVEIALREQADRGPARRVEGTLDGRVLPSSVAGKSLPAIALRVDLEGDTLRGDAVLDEPGVEARLHGVRHASGRLDLSLRARVAELARVPRSSGRIGARGDLALVADASLERAVLTGAARVEARRATVAGVDVDAARVRAYFGGSLAAPRVAVSGQAAEVRARGYALRAVAVELDGTPAQLDVALRGAGGTLDRLALRARVARASGAVRVEDLDGSFTRDGLSARIVARAIAVERGAVAVEGLVMEGLGAPIRADVRRTATELAARVAAPSFDLGRLARLIYGAPERFGGLGSLDLSVTAGGGQARGSAHAWVEGTSYLAGPALDASLDAVIDGAAVDGALAFHHPRAGRARIEAHVTLGAPSLDAASLAGATGWLALATDRIALSNVCALSPCSSELRGALEGSQIAFSTALEVRRDGQSADTGVHLDTRVHDRGGELARLGLDARLDWGRALSLGRVPDDAVFDADLDVAPRSIDELPPSLRPAALFGLVRARARARGTRAEPVVFAELAAQGLRTTPDRLPSVPALDLGWVGTYALGRATSHAEVRAGSAPVLLVSAEVFGAFDALIGRAPRAPPANPASDGTPWNATLSADFRRFPLSFVPALAASDMAGALSGRVVARGLHARPLVHGRLVVPELRLGDDSAGPVELAFDLDERACVAALTAGHRAAASPPGVAGPRGHAELRGSARCRFADGAVPSLDPSAPVEIALDADALPLAAFGPLVQGTVERLRGRADVRLRASGKAGDPLAAWSMKGAAHVHDGGGLPLDIGREFRRIEADLEIASATSMRIARLSGDVGTGAFTGDASFAIDGHGFREGQAAVHVSRGHAMPITLEGISYGSAWGDVFVTARRTEAGLRIDLRAPTLRGELPPDRSGSLESLDKNDAVVVLQPLGPEDLAAGGGPAEPRPPRRPIVIGIELGDNAGVTRDDMQIELATPPPPGNPRISVGEDVRVDGSIEILGGRVPVAGRNFRVERGVVRFGGDDPADPALDVDAVYEGTDASGTRIIVHVGGTAKDMELTLRSTPPKPRSELLAILAFGEPPPSGALGGSTVPAQDRGTASSGTAAGAGAAAVGSAVLTSGINQMLAHSIIPVRTSVSAGSSNAASASFELSERVRLGYIRQFGASQYGQLQDVNQFALDWRFRPRWLLRAVVGDRGTSVLDVLWQRWY